MPTYSVIDTFELRASWTHRHPELADFGEGLAVVVVLTGEADPMSWTGARVSVVRPDATCLELRIDRVEVGHGGATALMFNGLSARDVPRGSTVERIDVN
ncbi:MAG: hypothetical protein R3F34_19260 [Planctomycetota bacterium]